METEFQEICIDHEIRSLILKRISKLIFTTLYIYNRIFIIIRKLIEHFIIRTTHYLYLQNIKFNLKLNTFI